MDFYKQLEDYLINDEIELANKFYNNEYNSAELKKIYYWELASLFCTYLNKHYDENRLCDEIGEFCLEASIELCKNKYGNAKEIILIYLENSSKFQVNDQRFIKFIEILKYILLSIPSKQLLYSLQLACNTIYSFIKNSVVLPKKVNLEENEKQVFDHDLRIDRMIELTDAYIDFLDEFVGHGGEKIKFYLLNCLISLFDAPFGRLNTEGINKNLTDLRINSTIDVDLYLDETNTIKSVKRLFQVILKLDLNLLSIINREYEFANKEEHDIKMSNIALSVFAYITYSKHVGLKLTYNTSHLPSVHSYVFLFEQLQPCILCLLEQNEQQFLLEKGLKLSFRLFKHLKLIAAYIDNKRFTDFCNCLFRLAIYTNYDLIRRLGSNLLNFIFTRFETINDQLEFLSYYLNYSLFNKSNDASFNSYVYSFIIYLFKEEFYSSYIRSDVDFRIFEKFYFKIFTLENSVECDLMKNSNKITSTLNLLRFILMKDDLNKTNILCAIEETKYLKDIEKAVQLSKAHYELEMRNLKSNKDTNLEMSEKIEMKIENIKNGDELSTNPNELSYEQKLDAMNISLNTIDLIESLRVRCVELVEKK